MEILKTNFSEAIAIHWLSNVRQKTHRKDLLLLRLLSIQANISSEDFNSHYSETLKQDTFQRPFLYFCFLARYTDNENEKCFQHQKLNMTL